MSKTIVFDIETIPNDNISRATEEVLDEKFQKWLSYEDKELSSLEKENLRNKLRSINPYFGKVATVGIYCPEADKEEGLHLGDFNGEKELLERVWELFNRTDLFITFNGLGFDVPFLLTRSLVHNIIPDNRNFKTTRRFQRSPHYDTMMILGDWDIRKTPSLRLACEAFGIPSPKEEAVKAENVYDYYLKGDIQKVSDYCVKDVRATYSLFEKIVPMYPVY